MQQDSLYGGQPYFTNITASTTLPLFIQPDLPTLAELYSTVKHYINFIFINKYVLSSLG